VYGDPDKPDQTVVLAFPVNKKVHTEGSKQALYLALYIEIHSRLVSWWLVNAWRSKQLADATWQLSNSMQLIPAAACARSLVETAAYFWLDLKRIRELWSLTKEDYTEHGPNFQHYLDLSLELYKVLWGAKFDNRVPDLEKGFKAVPRPNVLTQIDRLARATDYPLQRDYQWLCNTVHPSIGGLLVLSSPLVQHPTKTHGFQRVCEVPPIITASTSKDSDLRDVPEALARAALLAVDVLEKSLNDALKVIDDIGLTTKAPKMASFDYWRNLVPKHGSARCPCRSGRKAKHCLHRWTDPTPTIVERFDIGAR
jgi:hypothetical protein